jgi:hypothetical protein
MTKPLVFVVGAYTGWHLFLSLLPERWQARFVARRWLRTLPHLPDFDATPVLIQLPTGMWRVKDACGRVEPSGEPRVRLPVQ